MAVANQMTVNTGAIRDAAKNITNLKSKYHEAWDAVFKKFQDIDNQWDGDDNTAFNDKVNSFRNDFVAMDDYFEKLINFLNTAADDYDRVEAERKQAAGTLAQ